MANPIESSECLQMSGLSAVEAAHRLSTEGPNVLPGGEPKSTAAIVREILTQPMFLMLLAAGGSYLALGDRAEALFLLAFVFVVIGITIVQDRRTRRALDALRDPSAPRALVVRDGVEQRVAGRDVVRGDLIVLHAGDRVPAYGRLLQGRLSLDESLLTGESVPVAKVPARCGSASPVDSPGGEGTAFVFASTVVTQGVDIAQVTATARATAVGRIGEALSATREAPSALQGDSNALVRKLGIGAMVLASAQVVLLWLWDGRPVLQSLLSGIALAMSIVPEEIPVIITVFLALGAWRISQQQVLTRRAFAVEALGTITVLAVDKTETLTQNRMTVAEVATPDAAFTPDGATSLPDDLHVLVEYAMLATPADRFDPMEKAIQEFDFEFLGLIGLGNPEEHAGIKTRCTA